MLINDKHKILSSLVILMIPAGIDIGSNMLVAETFFGDRVILKAIDASSLGIPSCNRVKRETYLRSSQHIPENVCAHSNFGTFAGMRGRKRPP